MRTHDSVRKGRDICLIHSPQARGNQSEQDEYFDFKIK